MIRIIADCGSTKSDWAVICNGLTQYMCQEAGINPCIQPEQVITDTVISVWSRICSNVPECRKGVEFHIYCAGCSTQKIKLALQMCIERCTGTPADRIHIESDLTGAARAVLQDAAGVVAILGTGSAAGYYDGNRITECIPSLGYILGDEGSGSYFGKRLLGDYFKKLMPPHVEAAFQNFAKELLEGQDMLETVLQNVYGADKPNRFLAQFVRFMQDNIGNKYVQDILSEGFAALFHRNLATFRTVTDSVAFVGSIACIFQEELEKTAAEQGFNIKNIIRYPIQSLISYHIKH